MTNLSELTTEPEPRNQRTEVTVKAMGVDEVP